MKTMQTVLSAVLVLLLGSYRPLRAEGFSLRDLNPFDGSEARRDSEQEQRGSLVDVSYRSGRQSPSVWTRMNHDVKRLSNGAKRFLANTADALCWKKSSPPPPPSRTSVHSWRTPSAPKKSSTSWFAPFWRREEPPLPRSPQDFVGMERPRM